jgi:hypothetical protein
MFKREHVYKRSCHSHAEARSNHSDHIERFYDPDRRQIFYPILRSILEPVAGDAGFPKTTPHAALSTHAPVSNAEILGVHRGG